MALCLKKPAAKARVEWNWCFCFGFGSCQAARVRREEDDPAEALAAKRRKVGASAVLFSETDIRFRPHLSGASAGTTHGLSLSWSGCSCFEVVWWQAGMLPLKITRLACLTTCRLARRQFRATPTQRLLEEDVRQRRLGLLPRPGNTRNKKPDV